MVPEMKKSRAISPRITNNESAFVGVGAGEAGVELGVASVFLLCESVL